MFPTSSPGSDSVQRSTGLYPKCSAVTRLRTSEAQVRVWVFTSPSEPDQVQFFLIYFPEGLGQTTMFLLMQRLQPRSACFLFPRRWPSEAGPSEAAVSAGATCNWMSSCHGVFHWNSSDP